MSKVSVNLKEVQKVFEQFSDVEEVKKKLKSVQSRKTRMKKQKSRSDYEVKMNEILKEEQILKEVRQMFEPKRKPVTQFTQEDVNNLDYDETVKAIKSIQSKKTNSQFLTDNIETNEEYQNALRIEEMLQEHRKNIKPVEETVVRKTEIETLIDNLENLEEKIDKNYIIEKLQELIK